MTEKEIREYMAPVTRPFTIAVSTLGIAIVLAALCTLIFY